jgi:hypothetical protein
MSSERTVFFFGSRIDFGCHPSTFSCCPTSLTLVLFMQIFRTYFSWCVFDSFWCPSRPWSSLLTWLPRLLAWASGPPSVWLTSRACVTLLRSASKVFESKFIGDVKAIMWVYVLVLDENQPRISCILLSKWRMHHLGARTRDYRCEDVEKMAIYEAKLVSLDSLDPFVQREMLSFVNCWETKFCFALLFQCRSHEMVKRCASSSIDESTTTGPKITFLVV